MLSKVIIEPKMLEYESERAIKIGVVWFCNQWQVVDPDKPQKVEKFYFTQYGHMALGSRCYDKWVIALVILA